MPTNTTKTIGKTCVTHGAFNPMVAEYGFEFYRLPLDAPPNTRARIETLPNEREPRLSKHTNKQTRINSLSNTSTRRESTNANQFVGSKGEGEERTRAW